MASLVTTLSGYLGYRGREGQWSFLLHRISGLGTGLFLTIHILDTSFVYFAPSLYMEAIKLYQSTLAGLGEVALVFCVFYPSSSKCFTISFLISCLLLLRSPEPSSISWMTVSKSSILYTR